MQTSILGLSRLLRALTRSARDRGWRDVEWARRAGVPKETLCRLRGRRSCDFRTLAALADAVGAELTLRDARGFSSVDDLWPRAIDRDFEQRLLAVAGSGSTQLADWEGLAPRFFLAGLAVVLASVDGFDRARYLELAEALHPGATEPRVFATWLAATPLPPSRFVPGARAALRDAA